MKPAGAALDRDMRLEGAGQDGVERGTVEVDEDGTHPGDALGFAAVQVGFVDGDEDASTRFLQTNERRAEVVEGAIVDLGPGCATWPGCRRTFGT